MPLVIYSLGGGHTHTHTHIHPHRSDFNKPGARQPAAGARAWFKNICMMLYTQTHNYVCVYVHIIMLPLILGVIITGGTVGTTVMSDGTGVVQASNVLDDNSVVYLEYSKQINGILFCCVTGYQPNDPNSIGDLYFNDILLPKAMCSGLVQVGIDRNPGVLNVHVCGNLTTSTEGVYTCRLMNSSMMYQSMSVGVYFSGRSKPLTSLYLYTWIIKYIQYYLTTSRDQHEKHSIPTFCASITHLTIKSQDS